MAGNKPTLEVETEFAAGPGLTGVKLKDGRRAVIFNPSGDVVKESEQMDFVGYSAGWVTLPEGDLRFNMMVGRKNEQRAKKVREQRKQTG